MTESQIQSAFILIVRNNLQQKYPELRWLHSIPNGGLRHPSVASQMVREGTVKGIPDLYLPVPRNGYHGLYIEFKTPIGKLSKEQKEFFAFASANGYACHIARSVDDGLKILGDYLLIPINI